LKRWVAKIKIKLGNLLSLQSKLNLSARPSALNTDVKFCYEVTVTTIAKIIKSNIIDDCTGGIAASAKGESLLFYWKQTKCKKS